MGKGEGGKNPEKIYFLFNNKYCLDKVGLFDKAGCFPFLSFAKVTFAMSTSWETLLISSELDA